jgi:hypothetical protein
MKKQIFIAAAFITATSITGQLFAQEPGIAAKDQKIKTKSNIKNDRVCVGTVTPTATGFDITFDHEVKSPRDAASGLATGKRMHKPYIFSVSAADNSITEVTAAPSAKSGGGSGKVSLSDLSVMITIKGKSQKLTVEDNKFSLPEDCPDGECDMVVSWSWGASNPGSSKKSYASGHFALSMDGGACMAINTKGTAATNH